MNEFDCTTPPETKALEATEPRYQSFLGCRLEISWTMQYVHYRRITGEEGSNGAQARLNEGGQARLNASYSSLIVAVLHCVMTIVLVLVVQFSRGGGSPVPGGWTVLSTRELDLPLQNDSIILLLPLHFSLHSR